MAHSTATIDMGDPLRPYIPPNETPEEKKKRIQHEKLAKKHSEAIDRQLKAEKEERDKQKDAKLLLLVLKQLKIIHGKGLEAERQQYRRIVYINILTAMKALTNAVTSLGYKLEIEKNQQHLEKFQKLTSIKDSLNCNSFTIQAAMKDQKLDDDALDLYREHVDSIKALWKDPAIKKCFNSANNIDRISKSDYLPTDEDILQARVRTVGVAEHKFEINRTIYSPYFDDVDAIIFMAAVSAFDQTLEEDIDVNRMTDSIQLFDTICNNPLMINTSVILFLNKIDILQNKLTYIEDTKQMRVIVASVNDIVQRENLRESDYSDPINPNNHRFSSCPTVKTNQDSNNLINSIVGDNAFQLNFTCGITDKKLCDKAELAFEEAGKVISKAFIFNTPIIINALFDDLNDRRLLGSAGPARLIPLVSDDKITRLYPQALVKQFNFTNHPEFNDDDIIAMFNAGANFWFENDGPIKPNQANFHTVILHELFHGLGFTSSYRDHVNNALDMKSDALSPIPVLTFETEEPTLLDPVLFEGFAESIFDRFVMVLPDTSDPTGTPPTSFTNFTNQLNNFGPPNTNFSTANDFFNELMASPEWTNVAKYLFKKATLEKSMMFVPRDVDIVDGTFLETSLNPYAPGSSISHVSEAVYSDTSDFLMRFALEPGLTIDDLIISGGNFSGGAVGPRLISIMNSLGYATADNPNPIIPDEPLDDEEVPIVQTSTPSSVPTPTTVNESTSYSAPTNFEHPGVSSSSSLKTNKICLI
ncbi:11288_t:CDS:10 [Diversispora eburnea]|uniref:11288_t:CDS:1 n=1 Tax=Diversispora eburnea TaxID=1213867 RepID=A0A9N8Z938_9GLOM|nr:11288_t:CDS:10 [Diversispora eburnea]